DDVLDRSGFHQIGIVSITPLHSFNSVAVRSSEDGRSAIHELPHPLVSGNVRFAEECFSGPTTQATILDFGLRCQAISVLNWIHHLFHSEKGSQIGGVR